MKKRETWETLDKKVLYIDEMEKLHVMNCIRKCEAAGWRLDKLPHLEKRLAQIKELEKTPLYKAMREKE